MLPAGEQRQSSCRCEAVQHSRGILQPQGQSAPYNWQIVPAGKTHVEAEGFITSYCTEGTQHLAKGGITTQTGIRIKTCDHGMLTEQTCGSKCHHFSYVECVLHPQLTLLFTADAESKTQTIYILVTALACSKRCMVQAAAVMKFCMLLSFCIGSSELTVF